MLFCECAARVSVRSAITGSPVEGGGRGEKCTRSGNECRSMVSEIYKKISMDLEEKRKGGDVKEEQRELDYICGLRVRDYRRMYTLNCKR